MEVKLIDYTVHAAEKLIFTKSTRLTLEPKLFHVIMNWPEEKKLEELKYIANTIRSSHEFVSLTFCITGVSRNFTHQFVRTRQASYAQQSMRVNNMAGFDFVMPEKFAGDMQALEAVNNHNAATDELYKFLVRRGHAVEDARSILPGNVATNITVKYNLRAFADLVRSRTGGRTQDEYQKVANAMVDEVLKIWPWAEAFIFDKPRDYFDEIEAFAKAEFPDLLQRGKLLKIVDKMRGVK